MTVYCGVALKLCNLHTVAAIVARPAHNTDASKPSHRVSVCKRSGDAEAGKLHQLFEREAVNRRHEFDVDGLRDRLR